MHILREILLIRSSVLDFLEQLSSNFYYKEQLFWIFGATFEQLFEKLRATFWEISSNLWKALVTTRSIKLNSLQTLSFIANIWQNLIK